MGKTIDTSELLYRMGKYAEIDVGKEGHDAFMHFMLLLTRTIEKMPNAALTHKNPIDDEIMENQYKLADAISLVTGRTRNDGWYPTWIGHEDCTSEERRISWIPVHQRQRGT